MAKIVRSAGGVVFNDKGQVVVVNQNGNSWSLPKGHLDPGEDDLAAARREILEEAGISDPEFIKKLGSYERPRIGLKGADDMAEIKRITLFLFRSNQTTLSPTDPKNPEARWVDKNKVEALLTHPKDKQFYLSILKEIVS